MEKIAIEEGYWFGTSSGEGQRYNRSGRVHLIYIPTLLAMTERKGIILQDLGGT